MTPQEIQKVLEGFSKHLIANIGNKITDVLACGLSFTLGQIMRQLPAEQPEEPRE